LVCRNWIHLTPQVAALSPETGAETVPGTGMESFGDDMVTFTINIPQMLAYMPYMDPMG